MFKLIIIGSVAFASFMTCALFLILGVWRQVTRKYEPESLPKPALYWWTMYWAGSFTGMCFLLDFIEVLRDLFRR